MAPSNDDFGSLLGGTAVVFVGFVVQTGLVFLLRVTFARYLSVESFGLVAIFMALINVAGLVAVGGLNVGLGRYLPRFDSAPADRADLVRSALEVAVPLSLAIAAVIFLSADWLAVELFESPRLGPLFAIAAVATPFFGLQRIALGVARGQERTVPKVVIENLLVPVSQVLLAVAVIVLGLRTTGIAWAYAGGFVVSGLIGAWYLLGYTPLELGTRGTMHRQLTRFSAPLVVTGMLFHLIHYLDTFLLGYFATTQSVAVYNTVYPLSLLTTVFLVSFVFLLLPAVSGLDVEDEMERADHLFKLTAKWIVFLTYPVVMVMFFFPELTIAVTFGEKYTAGAFALSVLAGGFLVHAAIGSTDKGLIAVGRTRLVLAGNLAAAAVNVVLNVVLIPAYGFLGAAVASVIAFWTLDLVWLYFLYRIAGIVPVSTGMVRGLGLSVPVTAALCVGLGHGVAGSLPGVAGVVVLAGLAHLLIVVRYGDLTAEEMAVLTRLETELDLDLSAVRRTVGFVRR